MPMIRDKAVIINLDDGGQVKAIKNCNPQIQRKAIDRIQYRISNISKRNFIENGESQVEGRLGDPMVCCDMLSNVNN